MPFAELNLAFSLHEGVAGETGLGAAVVAWACLGWALHVTWPDSSRHVPLQRDPRTPQR